MPDPTSNEVFSTAPSRSQAETEPVLDEQALLERLQADPDDIEATLRLCSLLMAEGRPVPLELQERGLLHYLAQDPSRHDLAFRLSQILAEQRRPVPLELEEKALRHAIAAEPGRMDLYDRFMTVAAATCLAAAQVSEVPAATPEDRAIVDRARDRLMRIHAQTQPDHLPTYGVRWGEYARRVQASIAGFSDPVEAMRFAQTEIGFEHRIPAGQALRHFSLYEREIRSEFPQYADHLSGFDDPPLSSPQTQFAAGGRAVSNIVPYLARIIMSCLSKMPAPRTVLELGGGYGAPARLWLRNPIAPAKTFIIVDIPESLFFADVFLSTTFGPEAVHYVENSDPIDPSRLEHTRIILCPVPHLAAIEALPVDLVINTGSFQEMSDEWVSHYMSWLDRQNVRFFYSLNYAAQPVGALYESINLWSPRPSSRWVAKHLRWNPVMVRMQTDRNYLEAVYERTDAVLPAAAADARLAALGERTLCGDTLVEYLDIFRRRPLPEVALTIVRRAMAEMPFHPKEALWLAEWLQRHEDKLTSEERSEIAGCVAKLAAERAAGIEGTT